MYESNEIIRDAGCKVCPIGRNRRNGGAPNMGHSKNAEAAHMLRQDASMTGNSEQPRGFSLLRSFMCTDTHCVISLIRCHTDGLAASKWAPHARSKCAKQGGA